MFGTNKENDCTRYSASTRWLTYFYADFLGAARSKFTCEEQHSRHPVKNRRSAGRHLSSTLSEFDQDLIGQFCKKGFIVKALITTIEFTIQTVACSL